MLIREEDYFEIILNALCLETHNISLKFKTEFFFFISQCLFLLTALSVVFIFLNFLGPVANPGN